MGNERYVIMYSTPEGDVRVQAVVKDETLWLTQKGMATLFDVNPQAITKHLSNIYAEGELQQEATCSKMEQVQEEGGRPIKRQVLFYNLDAVISVGYRVNSMKATKFRQWATKVLKEFMQKGFALDDERLKQGKALFGKDYFRELLDRVRSIRASERRIWQQITDIYAECSIDYDRYSPTTKDFYAMIQNKFHFAIVGQTAAEIVYRKVDANADNMGLTTWKHAPNGRILKSDVVIAKNYLQKEEIRKLERAVSGYFDYVEDLIERENTFTMAEFAKSVNEFLAFRRYQVLPDNDKGSISHADAEAKASEEYEKFKKIQKIVSDFDLDFGLMKEEGK